MTSRQLQTGVILAGCLALLMATLSAPAWMMALFGAALLIPGVAGLFTPPSNRIERDMSIPDTMPRDITRLLDAVPAPLIITDRRGLVLSANAAARAIYPTLRAEAPLSFAIRNPQLLQALERCIGTGEPMDLDLVERVPLERSFAVRIVRIIGDETEIGREAALISMLDTTSMRRTEQMRVDFVANASHELRTPLASIMGFVETLQGAARNDPEVRDRFLGIMAQQGRRMARLIEDLLSLSRIELNAHLMPEDDIEIIELLSGVIDGLSALAYERGVRLDFAEGKELVVHVKGARDELIRVFENLIENAIKYGQTGGRVDIAARRNAAIPREFQISIRDYGPGIAPEHLPRLTERFYRVDVASSRDKGGTGLGLAIVKHILNRHRGRLTIESEAGAGAAFTVTLQARDASA
jgi:two-component system, OmpR family, phosphate regulon sensor histidine kinase PhoR